MFFEFHWQYHSLSVLSNVSGFFVCLLACLFLLLVPCFHLVIFDHTTTINSQINYERENTKPCKVLLLL